MLENVMINESTRRFLAGYRMLLKPGYTAIYISLMDPQTEAKPALKIRALTTDPPWTILRIFSITPEDSFITFANFLSDIYGGILLLISVLSSVLKFFLDRNKFD